MVKIRKDAVAFSSYITQELKILITFLVEREEITKVVFIRKAVRHFLGGDKIIDERVKIPRGRENYIPRSVIITSYIDVEQKKKMEEIALSQGTNFSAALYQALLEYSVALIAEDNSGIIVENKKY